MNKLRLFAFRTTRSTFVTGYICAILDITLIGTALYFIIR
jgi:hypothetical protein